MSTIDIAVGTTQLSPILLDSKLMIFCGAGISVDPPANLPTWDGFLEKFIGFCENIDNTLPPDNKFTSAIAAAKHKKKSHPIEVSEVLKNELIKTDKALPFYAIENTFKSWFTNLINTAEPNENHKAIVSTNYPLIMTTNYDNCLEKAAYNAGYKELASYSYSFKSQIEQIASNIYLKNPAIIHLHGNIEGILLDNIVFTYKDYVAIKRKYPGFTLILQSLFLNYSTLFVGYGASDPHLEDLIDDITFALNFSTCDNLPRIYMALPKNEIDEITARYKEIKRTTIIAFDNYSDVTVLLKNLQTIKPRL